jgi:tetratricopeptide (TPR) repeat protein
VLEHHDEDDRGWALLGLCQTLLGNFRFAVTAYRNALTRAPANPWYAHNLGHLLDVALGKAKDAIPLLRSAYASAQGNTEIATSFAHALARGGDLAEAKQILGRSMKATRSGPSREQSALMRWLDDGAPPGKDQPTPRPSPIPRRLGKSHSTSADSADAIGEDSPHAPHGTRTSRARRGGGGAGKAASELEKILTRGLASLPLDAKQRARAKELSRDALVYFAHVAHFAPPGPRVKAVATVPSLAAAVAYAIVYVDHVPLTQAEVAACFRVSVASLRGRFGELRAHLDLTPGDARYATHVRRG